MRTIGQRFYRIVTFQMFTLMMTFIIIQQLTIDKNKFPSELNLSQFSTLGKIQIKQGNDQGETTYGSVQSTKIQFLLNYNIEDMFQFTTKQFYLSINAKWNDQYNGLQQQVIWDLVVENKDIFGKKINKLITSKYPLRSIEGMQLSDIQDLSFDFFIEEMQYGGWLQKFKFPLKGQYNMKDYLLE